MGKFMPLRMLVAVCGLLWLCGCGGATVAPDTQPDTGTPQNAFNIPDIWDLDEVAGRSASIIIGDGSEPIVKIGSDFLLEWNGTVDGEALFLNGTGDGPDGDQQVAWGLYRISELNGLDPQTMNIQALPETFGDEYFVGLANFSGGNWDWFGPVSIPEFELDLSESNEQYISELGNMYFVLITEHGAITHDRTTLLFGESEGDERPGRPHELVASDGDFPQHVAVSWNGGMGAAYYEVYRRLDGSNEDFEKIGTTEGTTYDDENVEPGHYYIYKVRGCNDVDCSDFSNTDSGYAGENNTGEGCPHELVATDGTYAEKVRLEWVGNPDLAYDVYRKAPGTPGEEPEFEFLGLSDGNSYNDFTAEPGVVYAYKVGLEGEGQICFSNIDEGHRSGEQNDPCPTELWASDGTYETKVRLEWQGVPGTLYQVHRRADGTDDWHMIGETDDLAFNDETAEPGVVYIYKVSYTHENETCYSTTDSGYRGETSGGDDECPTELSASDGTHENGVWLEWNGSVEVAYDIFRKVDGTDDWEWLAYVDNLEYFDETAEEGVHYVYKVGLGQNWGECFSNTDGGYRGERSGEGGCPFELSASDGTTDDGVVLHWFAEVPYAYDIYRRVDGTENWEWLAYVEGTEYLDETAELGVTYIYKVGLGQNWGECFSNHDSGYRGEGDTPGGD